MPAFPPSGLQAAVPLRGKAPNKPWERQRGFVRVVLRVAMQGVPFRQGPSRRRCTLFRPIYPGRKSSRPRFCSSLLRVSCSHRCLYQGWWRGWADSSCISQPELRRRRFTVRHRDGAGYGCPTLCCPPLSPLSPFPLAILRLSSVCVLCRLHPRGKFKVLTWFGWACLRLNCPRLPTAFSFV